MTEYDPNAPLIRAKTNYAKDKYNESERKIEERRLRSEKEALITDEKLVSFVGEVPTPTEENKKGEKENGI